MNRILVIFLGLTFWGAACSSPQTTEQPAASSEDQAEPAAASARGTAEIALGATQVSINYGRPQLQGRDMLSQLPDGQIWRLGMDDATTLEITAMKVESFAAEKSETFSTVQRVTVAY